jgi:hypothetical protein
MCVDADILGAGVTLMSALSGFGAMNFLAENLLYLTR